VRKLKTKGFIFIISGPSGSGKTTLLVNVLKDKDLKKKITRSVSFTTRPKRSGERNGKDYIFISEKKFRELKRAKKILEWTKYLGYYYGTPKDIVDKQLKSGNSIVLCLDLKGAGVVKKLYPGQVETIFIVAPFLDVLHARIRNRCSRTAGREIRDRLNMARKELKAASRYDWCLLNQDLAQVTGELKEIISKKIFN